MWCGPWSVQVTVIEQIKIYAINVAVTVCVAVCMSCHGRMPVISDHKHVRFIHSEIPVEIRRC